MKIMKTAIVFLVLLCASIGVNAQVPSYVPSSGLIGWWPFNGNANDQSGHALNGTVTAATLTTDRNNNANAAYSFNGVNGTKIQVNDNAIMHTNTFTVSAWEYVTDPTIYNNIVSKRIVTGGSNSYILYEPTKSSCTLCNLPYQPFEIAATIGGTQRKTYLTYSALDSVLNNTWNMITGTYDGSTLKYYVNGQLIRSLAVTGNVTYTTDPLYFGTTGATGQNFKGKIDDIGIWDRALSASEIMGLYTGITAVAQADELADMEKLSIFPNPAKEEISIRVEESLIGQSFKIYNQNGALIKSGKLDNKESQVNVEFLASGNYSLVLENKMNKIFSVVK